MDCFLYSFFILYLTIHIMNIMIDIILTHVTIKSKTSNEIYLNYIITCFIPLVCAISPDKDMIYYGRRIQMKLKDLKSILNAELVTGENLLEREIDYAFSSDLMSDVLAFANKKTVLLTGLINPQVVRTAEMLDLPAIIFVRNKKPDGEIVKLALQNEIVLMCTDDTLYTASGKLYTRGLYGIQLKS